jgi:3-(3-hydroxy-phenyl)propionate hydroxylase
MQKWDVIIAGGGPVGLATALQLGRAGLNVALYERGDIRHQEPRASTLHAATLDILDDLGVYHDAEALGIACPFVRYWDRPTGKLVAEFDHAVLAGEVRFPWALQCEQDKLSRIIHNHLKLLPNVEICAATHITRVQQSEDGVEAFATSSNGIETRVTADFLVGADGARSTVRQSCNISFEGFTYPERFLIISTPHDFMGVGGYAFRNYVLDPDRWATLFKISWDGPPGIWRMVTPALPDETVESLESAETAEERLQQFFPRSSRYDVPFFNWYTVDQRVAAQFRQGRILLAGDAAHLNNPLGAMGLNSGLHDAANLSEKLIDILRGAATLELLDQYERQRRHVAVEHVQQATIADKKNLEQRDAAARTRYLENLERCASDRELSKKFLMRASLADSLREAAAIQ